LPTKINIKMNLVIDIGNTFFKIYIFELNKLVFFKQISGRQEIEIEMLMSGIEGIKNGIVSSVRESSHAVVSKIKKHYPNIIEFDHHTPIPVKNMYETPETLGKDRLAGVVGAYNIYKDQNVLAIDSGTAITYDFVNSHSEYLGGNISPGMEMRFKALSHFTEKLPLCAPQDGFQLLGASTRQAIVSGVQNGIIFEMDAYIDTLKEQYNPLRVILTGGDTFFFAHKLKNTIFAEPNLVAIGLNHILQYNVKQN
jgi:type III pantothenate kinase